MAERDTRLDGLKGLAMLSVVFIHTVFWSGLGYVPAPLRGLSLLVEVPLFFFLAGWSYAKVSKPGTAWRNLWRLQMRYMAFVALVWLAISLFTRQANPVVLLAWWVHIYLPSEPLKVVMGSMWFMRVYLGVSALAILILSFKKQWAGGITLLLIALVYALGFASADITHDPYVMPFEFLAFYLALFLLGHTWANGALSHTFMAGLTVLALLRILFSADIAADLVNLQAFKFPPQSLYFAWSWLALALLLALSSLAVPRRLLASALLQWTGRNAIYVFFAQGISASLIYWPARHFFIPWGSKLVLMYLLNVVLALMFAWLLREAEARGKHLFFITRARLQYSR